MFYFIVAQMRQNGRHGGILAYKNYPPVRAGNSNAFGRLRN